MAAARAALVCCAAMGQQLRWWVPLVALLAVACESTPGTDTYEVTGLVSEFVAPEAPGDPIPGAMITFRSDTLLVATTTTDQSGHYRLRVTTDYAFGQVRAEAAGFVTAEETVYFDQPQRRVDIQMRAAPP